MSRRKQKPTLPQDPKKHRALLLAVLSADGFHACALPLVRKLSGMSIREAPHYAGDHLAEVVVAATTLALSIELYLKALWMLAGDTPPDIHPLWALYKKLPPKLKTSIQAAYQGLPPHPVGMAAGVAFDLAPVGNSTPSQTSSTEKSLRAVLIRSSDVFVTWRYFHQVPTPGRPSRLAFEFFQLDAIANILKAHTAQALGGYVVTAPGARTNPMPLPSSAH